MTTKRVIIPGNHNETITFATQHFIDTAQSAIAEKGAFYVALSGGSTPKEIYQKLASPPFRNCIDWTRVHLFWSDERTVPPSDPSSNYHMAMTSGLDTLPISPLHIHRMRAEEEIDKNAALYEKLLPACFDLIMLGMGDDGHTASLFPGTKALQETTRLITPNFVEKLNTWRMTFTYPLINQAKQAVIYVLGVHKQERLRSIFKKTPEDPEFPIEKIGTTQRPALWIVDQDASALISHP